MTTSQQDGELLRQHASHGAPTIRRKVTLYLDYPKHFDAIDDLLRQLRKMANLPRDQSMLVRALLDQATEALADPSRLQTLARSCASTLPNR